MIDTLVFTTSEFTYNHSVNALSNYPLRQEYCSIKNGEEEKQPLLLIDKTGKEYRCKELNTKGKSIRGTGNLTIGKIRGTGITSLRFQVSIPKFLKGDNFVLADRGDLKKYYYEVEKELKEIGCTFNIENCQVSRLDLTRNIETNYRFNKYIPVLRQCSCSRYKQKEINAETYQVGDNSRVICNYNKIEEVINNTPLGQKVKLPIGMTTDTNIFRCESRILNSAALKRCTKNQIVTTKDLFQGYELLRNLYQQNVKQKMLVLEKMESVEETINTEEMFRNSCCKFDKQKDVINDFFQTFLIQGCKDRLKEIRVDDFSNLYVDYLTSNNDFTESNIRQKRCRFRKDFQDVLVNLLSKMEYGNIPVADLYNELYEKLLSA